MSPASALGVRALPPQMSLSFPLSGRRGVRREAAGVEPQCPSDPIPHRPQMYYPSNSTLIQASVEVMERSREAAWHWVRGLCLLSSASVSLWTKPQWKKICFAHIPVFKSQLFLHSAFEMALPRQLLSPPNRTLKVAHTKNIVTEQIPKQIHNTNTNWCSRPTNKLGNMQIVTSLSRMIKSFQFT